MNVEKYKLATMFSLMFASAFIVISTVFYYYSYVKQVDSLNLNLKSQAKSVLDFADVLLESRNEKFFNGDSSEIPQVIQNDVFDKFTSISGGKVFFKEASITPVNPKNKATDYESEIINNFKNNRQLKEIEKIVNDSNKEYYMLSRPMISEEKCIVCHPTWTVGQVIAIENVRIDMDDFYTSLRNNIFLTILTGLINIIMILILTHYLFNKYVSVRIHKLLELIFRVEKGNFVIDDLLKGEKLQQGSSSNEVDRLFRHLKQMVDTLKPVISNVVEVSKNMAFQSSYSFVKIDQTNQLVQQQYNYLNNSKDKLINVLNENDLIKDSLNNLIASSQNSKTIIKNSQTDVANNLKKGKEAANSMDQTSQTIKELKVFSDEVSKMTALIIDIADETNLISLNAAIEAARAGVHGRTFSVVSDKIRDLAEVSRQNADAIITVLSSIEKQIDKVGASALSSKESVLALVDNSYNIDKSFDEIKVSFDLISSSLNTLTHEFGEESKSLKEVEKNLNDVENSSKVLAQNAETTKAIMDTISNKSAELKTLADGFEVVFNNRGSKRTVITPPILALDHQNHQAYIFDISNTGISFYFSEEKIQRQKDEKIILNLQVPINNKNKYECTIVYISGAILKDVYFYGAKF